ncbi:hypothetical protein IH982_00030 [Patescibacteria group bacterium]|nr:hypothetical protein [Patescibacteria group bacterium]
MGLWKARSVAFVGAFVLIFISGGVFGFLAHAVDFSSTNFILRDPVITVEGGRSTSASFEFLSSTGQPIIGESTSAGFIHRAGFLYFEEVSVALPPPLATLSPQGPSVVFFGKAYPDSEVILLKDGQIAGTAQADGAANFSLSTGALSTGDYLFSLYGRDYTGRSSRLISFSVSVVFNTTTTIRSVIVPPTIAVDKRQVAKGEFIDLFGQSVPAADIVILVKTPTGEFSVQTVSGQQGRYRYSLDTSSLEFGDYSAVAEASLQGSFSGIASAAVNFTVAAETILKEPIVCPFGGDLNGDCLVNLIDFSILIFWFDRPNVPSRVDLNGDGKADLVDFSIMAFYWTG